jgi:transposase
MLTVEQYARIRQLRRDGRTIRQIAEELNHSSKTILKSRADLEPKPNAPIRPAPIFGPSSKSSADLWPNTATAVATIKSAATCNAAAARRSSHWTTAILHGLVEAFRFFDALPVELWWDNPRTVAVHLFQGRQRTLHPRQAALVSHYTLTPKFCLPATATEKPRVKNRVYDLQRQWATPVPQVKDLKELNAHLRQCCLHARMRTCGQNIETVGVRFERGRAVALTPPEQPFDACVVHRGQVDKYQTVRFDGNAYSVPRRHAFRSVTVKGYVDRIAIVADGQVVAIHPRSYGRREKVLDSLHFLVVLEKKPAALDHPPVYRDWQLPAAFCRLRQSLEACRGRGAGTRQYIRVLQLLARHPLTHVERAILSLRSPDDPDVSALLATVEQEGCDRGMSVDVPAVLNAITVPLPELSASISCCPLPSKEAKPMNEANALLLKANLKQLKLPTMLAEWEKLAREAADHDESYDAYLLRLTELELATRAANAVAKASAAAASSRRSCCNVSL